MPTNEKSFGWYFLFTFEAWVEGKGTGLLEEGLSEGFAGERDEVAGMFPPTGETATPTTIRPHPHQLYTPIRAQHCSRECKVH